MRRKGWLGASATIGGGLALALIGASPAPAVMRASQGASGPTPTPVSTSTPQPTPTSGPGLVFVANADSGPVTAYNPTSSGAVTPARTVNNPQNPNTVWDPWGVAFDSSGNMFVQSFLSDATTFVYPPGAGSTSAPSRIFQANEPDNNAIAVDSSGYEYVVGGESGPTIAVEAPGASGVAGNLYHVPPLREIPLPGGFNPWPSILSVDSQNEVLAAVTTAQGNSIQVFSGGAYGGTNPLRVISGPDTGLGSCSAPSPCTELSITYSSLTGEIYAAVSDGASTRILVFAGNASGDAAPIQSIEGPNTGLAGNVITGIAVSPADATIYAMVKGSEFAAGQVNAYASYAQGNTTPLRSFTDAASGFADAEGIAIH